MFQREHTLDENPRGDHIFRVKVAKTHQTGDFNDGGFCGGGHNGAEVARRFAIHQIAPAVGLVRFDQGKIGLDRVFEDVMTTVDFAGLFAFSQRRAVTGRRKYRAQAGAGGLDSRREITLRTSSSSTLPRR